MSARRQVSMPTFGACGQCGIPLMPGDQVIEVTLGTRVQTLLGEASIRVYECLDRGECRTTQAGIRTLGEAS